MITNFKRAVCAILITLSGALFAANTTNTHSSKAASFNPAQVKNIQQIIHDYLIANPEVLVDAWKTLQQKQQAQQEQFANNSIRDNFKALFYDKDNPVAGNKNGSVTLVEFFDYQCVHCRDIGPIIENLIEKHKNLRVVFKDWPIFGGNSILAAKAAFAANLQGKYLPYHNLLLHAKPPLDNANIMQLAKKAGLNLVKFKQDMQLEKWNEILKANGQLAGKMKLVGTPAFIISNKSGSKIKFIPGGVSEQVFSDIIDTVGAKK